ncbi:MAG: M28 family peptidase [Phycisphaerales bacterium]|nr:M28 family peptidase [Phycisphaerales bacterium]
MIHSRMNDRASRRAGTIAALAILGAGIASSSTLAQEAEAARPSISEVIQASTPDVREYNEHLIILSSPWMEGRLPGTRGMELAREYVETQFMETGLVGPVENDEYSDSPYRQSFGLGGSTEFADQKLMIGDEWFKQTEEFEMTGLGSDAGITAPISFVGYSIASGPEDYASYEEDDDLSGRIAIMFRFEPMNEDGQSLWSERGWSYRSTFSEKFNALAERNPAGVILVNPPGVDDPRANEMMTDATRVMNGVPVFMATSSAAERMLQSGGDERSIEAWRELADSGEGGAVHIDGPMLTMEGSRKNIPLMGENVMAMLPGRGELKDEYIVIGAHLDHLGMGEFGSRSSERALHPGADDNASGVAAIIMLGKSLSAAYDELGPDEPARSIILAGFDGEESGLNGSRHYVRNPIFPIEDHVLMINFDMIGRIENKRLSVSGSGTGGEDMVKWAAEIFEASNLDIVVSEASSGGSDHSSFLGRNVPILFGITPFPLHDDYHTPRDTPDKINREDAVETVYLFHDLAYGAATRPERFEFAERSGGGGARGRARSMPKVQLGIRSTTDEDEPGIRVVMVLEGLSAEEAGIKEGDRILVFNGEELTSRRDLIDQLRGLEPDTVITAKVVRDGEEMDIEIKLKGRVPEDE